MAVTTLVETKNPLKYWHELLEQWVFLVERIYRITKKKQAVYSFKERTNVGLFAAAAMANGWIALEECRSEKFTSEETDDTYQGWSDLRIWRDRRHHEIEAKFVRVALASSGKKRIDKACENAVKNSIRSTASGDQFDKKIALTFIVPTLSKTQFETWKKEEIDEETEKLIQYVKTFKPHLLAYTFPGATTAIGSNNRKALGIILVGAVTERI